MLITGIFELFVLTSFLATLHFCSYILNCFCISGQEHVQLQQQGECNTGNRHTSTLQQLIVDAMHFSFSYNLATVHQPCSSNRK